MTVATKAYLALLLRETTWTLPEQDLSITNEVFPMPASGLKARFEQAAGAGAA